MAERSVENEIRSLLLPRHTAKPEIRGRAVWSVLAPGSTSISVTVRLMEEEKTGKSAVTGFKWRAASVQYKI